MYHGMLYDLHIVNYFKLITMKYEYKISDFKVERRVFIFMSIYSSCLNLWWELRTRISLHGYRRLWCRF